LRFAAMQGILRRSGRELFLTARAVGFDGVELDLAAGEDDPVLTPPGRAEVQAAAAATGLAVPSICLGALNRGGLGSPDADTRARADALIRRAIALAADVGARVLLVPFFGDAELRTPDHRARAALGLRALAPAASRAGVVLAVEDTLSGADNLSLLAAAGQDALAVYFDVSNAMWWGHDSPTEIRRLGSAIAQIHFKDGRGGHSNAMLGHGHVDFPAVAQAIRDVGYDGWIVLESAAPHDPVEDARTNLAFARRCLGLPEG
jgi:L-ribulose-5-phosphate 3-epimerase